MCQQIAKSCIYPTINPSIKHQLDWCHHFKLYIRMYKGTNIFIKIFKLYIKIYDKLYKVIFMPPVYSL